MRFKHPAVAQYETKLRFCLQQPDFIRASVKDADVHLYYLQVGKIFLCLVVAPGDGDSRFVVTAYLTKRAKPGDGLWTK